MYIFKKGMMYMKKRLLIGLMMLCMIIFTGCVDADVTVDLEKDGTGKAIVELVGPEAIFNNIPQETINEWAQSFDTVEKISKSDKTGYKFTTKQEKLDELLKEVTKLNGIVDEGSDESLDSANTTRSESSPIVQKTSTNNTDNNSVVNNIANEFYQNYVDVQEEKSLFSSSYNISLKLKDAIYSEMSDKEKTLMGVIGRSANIGLHIKSPIEAKSNNATSQTKEDDKYVYNWEYTLADVQNINFSATIPNVRNIVITTVCGLAILVAIIAMIIRKRK